MGIFAIDIKVRNWDERHLPLAARHEVVTQALVDTGAVELALPAEMLAGLNLEPVGLMLAETADGGFHELRVLAVAEVEVQGRTAQVRVIELPRGARPLLGAIPLESMDWHVSPRERKLIPNPRFPDLPVLPLMPAG
jgi:clan AA aspartic protease